MSDEFMFAHPRGAFEITIKRRAADELCFALLKSHASYVTLDFEGIGVESRAIALEFVKLCDKLTNGLATLAQRRREETRLQFHAVHAELLKRGCHVLGGRLALARLHKHRDAEGYIANMRTELAEITAAVVTGEDITQATMLMPAGEVAPQDKADVPPARELEWGE